MGEALIDIVVDTQGEVNSIVGGAPLNTARTISRLGHPVSFIGGISHDSFGRRIKRELESDGVVIAIDQGMPEPSTVAIASLDHTGAATYRFLLEGTSACSVTVDQAIAAFNPRAMALHVGTLALVLRPLAGAVCAVVDSMGEHQILMVDPNARPSVMTEATSFQETFDHVLGRADVIKVSGDDLQFLFPGQDPALSARNLHASRGAVVLFTNGAESVSVFVAGSEQILAVPPVDVVDSVGAGDSFSGAFLSCWLQNHWTRDDLQDVHKVLTAARFGIKVAGLTCQKPGAQPPFAREL